jgi:hypothetical protein
LTFAEWCEEEWKVRYLADFQELADAEATVKRLKIVRLGLWRESGKGRTSEAPIIIDLTKQLLRDKESSSSSAFACNTTEAKAEEEEDPPPIKEPKPPEAPQDPIEEVRAAYPANKWDDAKTREAYRQNIQSAAEHKKLLEGLSKHKQSERWQDRAGQWIPFASNFIAKGLYAHDPPPKFAPGTANTSGKRNIIPDMIAQIRAEKAKKVGSS